MAFDELNRWLLKHGLAQYASVLAENAIDLDVLDELERDDLRELGIPIGDVRRLLRAIRESNAPDPTSPESIAKDPRRPELKPATEAQRRQLTVMFADLVGSTALSQALDPEDLRELNRAYQDAAKTAIEHFGGFVARYMGDGVLAYFGYPAAHEDDPERAIRSGLAMVDAIPKLEVGRLLNVRVGISTGPVVVGDVIGEGASQESAVVGETPNLAARLQGIAEPGTVVVGPSTKRLVPSRFDYRALGNLRLKGIAESTPAFEVLGESQVDSRLREHAASVRAPMVGREEELSLLKSRWDSAKSGEGQLVLLSGEPGIGKSRVTESMVALARAESVTHLRYFCSPHHSTSALHPVIAQLKHAAGFEPDDTAEQRLSRLEQMNKLTGRPVDDVPVLALLLSLPLLGRHPELDLAPELLKAHTLDVLASTMEALADRQPTLVILEDAQWLDPTTTELFTLVIERLPATRILLLVTHRPEFTSPWPAAHATTLSLNRLERAQGRQVIESVTAGKPLPEVLLEHVLSKTDGIPLFLEELTKSILESGVLRETPLRYELKGPLPEGAVPTTLQDSLMARLDRLGEVREIAQIGAVIGRTFAFKLLEQVTAVDEASLSADLARIVESELVIQRGRSLDATFTFKHALVQDAAYGSLLNRRREEIHRQIAAAIEAHAPETVETQPELLAQHLTLGRQFARAADFWLRAGRQATDQSANNEAVAHLRKGLSVVSELMDSEQKTALELDFHLALFVPLAASQFWSSAETSAVYERAEALCERLGRTESMRLILFGRYSSGIISGNFADATDAGNRLLKIGQDQGSTSTVMNAHRWLCWPALYRGELDTVNEHVEASLALYDARVRDAARGRSIVDPRVEALCIRAQHRWLRGDFSQSSADSTDAIAQARVLSHPTGLAYAIIVGGLITAGFRGEARVAADLSAEGIALANDLRAPVFQAWAQICRGWALAQLGERDEGIALIESRIAEYRTRGGGTYSTAFLSWLAQLHLLGGNLDAAAKGISEGFDAAATMGERFFLPELHRLSAELHRARGPGEVERARLAFETGLDIARQQGAGGHELRNATGLARLMRDTGEPAAAAALLEPLRMRFADEPVSPDLEAAGTLYDSLGASL